MEQQRLLEKLKEASSILIIAHPDNEEAVLGACALVCAHKKNTLFEASIPHENLKKQLKETVPGQLWDGIAQRGHTIISIDTLRAPVKELRYENNRPSGTLDIHIVPHKNSITKEHLNITHTTPSWDVILLIGIHDTKTLKRVTSGNEHALITDVFAYIGVGAPKENFISICNECANQEEFAQTIYNLTFENNESSELSTTLLFALIKKIISDSQCVSPKSFSLAATLLEKGANNQRADTFLKATKTSNIQQEHASNKSQINKIGAISFATLPINNELDSQKAHSFALSLLTKDTVEGAVVFLKNDKQETPGMFKFILAHKNQEIQKGLLELLGTHQQNGIAFFYMHAQNQPQAQEKITKLIETSLEYINRIT